MATATHAVDFSEIVRAVSLETILSRYGTLEKLRGTAGKRRGVCPLHQGTNRDQFVVNLTKNYWFCFSPQCHRGGGILAFVSLIEGVPIRDAARLIAQWYGITRTPQPAIPQQRRKPMADSKHTPSFKVFAVSDREWKDPQTGELKSGWWSRIGTAFPTKDDGHTILFDALPTPTLFEGKLQTRVVLRPFVEEDEPAQPAKKGAKK